MSDPLDDDSQEGSSQKSRDEVLRKKSFSRARGLDISSFMVSNDDSKQDNDQEEIQEKEHDIAMGEIVEIFSAGGDDSSKPGAVQKDGTVIAAPENDSVTDVAIHGEKRLGFGLLIAMVFTWSAIGTIVGTVLTPVVSATGLLLMVII